MSQSQNNNLNLSDFEIFLSSLSGMDELEKTKSKELFIRNKISDYKTAKKQLSHIPWLYYIPPFIVFLFFRKSQKIELKGEKEKISNMLKVWKAELSYCYSDLEKELRK